MEMKAEEKKTNRKKYYVNGSEEKEGRRAGKDIGRSEIGK